MNKRPSVRDVGLNSDVSEYQAYLLKGPVGAGCAPGPHGKQEVAVLRSCDDAEHPVVRIMTVICF